MMQALHQAGFSPRHCPALAIEPLPLDGAAGRLMMALDEYHAVIFLSTNAVALGLEALRDYWPQWPLGPHWVAVGEATAGALREQAIPAENPAQGFNSEAVLALPCLRDLAEKKILVLRGEGGRDLLDRTLGDRGARVDYISLYRRVCDDSARWPETTPGAVLVTSVESWHCLLRRAGPRLAGALVVAGSERIAEAVRADGHDRVVAAASPRDEDMLECLKQNPTTR